MEGKISMNPRQGESAWSGIVTKWRSFEEKYKIAERSLILARMLICLYFFNHAYTKIEIWYYYRQPFPYFISILLPSSILVALDIKTTWFASILAFIAFIESGQILYNQLEVWYHHGYLYINELMVKKFALLGAAILILAQKYQNEKKTATAVAGLLLTRAKDQFSTKKSIILLVARLFMACLFLYVGITEIRSQLNNTVTHNGHQHRRRPVGDGHDTLWPKVTEFLLSLPYIVGFKVKEVSRLLALVLVLEAFWSWSWWASQLNIGYKIHAREHFVVNIGVAGGLMMLSFIGGGKYTVDEMLKKND